jgi:hypothetical protein
MSKISEARTKWWRKASIRQKFILGRQVGAIKDGLSYEEFEKIMKEKSKKRKKTITFKKCTFLYIFYL